LNDNYAVGVTASNVSKDSGVHLLMVRAVQLINTSMFCLRHMICMGDDPKDQAEISGQDDSWDQHEARYNSRLVLLQGFERNVF
ncbi:hypothetical protein SK128_000276, partial [Halocaridina rubra]